MSFFDETAERRGTNSVKWHPGAIASIASNPEAEPFWVADMDFLPEPHIKEAGLEVARKGCYGYPVFPDLEGAVSAWMKDKHGWDLPAGKIVRVPGLLHGIAATMEQFTDDDALVLVHSPMYKPFRTIAHIGSRQMLELSLAYDKETARFSFDKESYLEAARKCSVVLFCSPQNPSGIVFSEDELRFVLETAKELGQLVLSDEIHSDLVHYGRHIPMGMLNEGIGAKVVTYFAPSKTFNIAGEHCSFAVFSDPDMQERFMRHEAQLCCDEIGSLVGSLATAAYTQGHEYNNELCQYLGETVKAMRAYLKENLPELKLVNSDASYITFLDCSAFYSKAEGKVLSNPERYPGGEGGGILSRYLGVEASVAMNDGTWFGSGWKEFVRFNYGTSRAKCMAALERIVKAFKAL